MGKAIPGQNVTSASTTQEGVVELATSAETYTGTDTLRVVTPAGLSAVNGKFNDKFAYGQIRESIPRYLAKDNLAVLSSGVLYVVGVELYAGQLISSLTWAAFTTALSGGNNQWACLLDSSRVIKAISADGTSAAWAANNNKTFSMVAPWTVDTTAFYYYGLMINATTPPSLLGLANTVTQLSGLTPKNVGSITSAALTTPPTLGSTVGSAVANNAIGIAYAAAA